MSYPDAVMLTGSPTLGHLVNFYYVKKALDRLQGVFLFRTVTVPDQIPRRNGKTVVWHRYQPLAANTTPTTEGVVTSTPATIASRVVSATVSQYANFTTVSDLLADTAPDPIIEAATDLLGEQAGLSIDLITRSVIDSVASSTAQTPLGSFVTAADLKASRHMLRALNVMPYDDGYYTVIASPFITYDIMQDPTAGGFVDVMKNLGEESGLIRYGEPGSPIAKIFGCKILESTNVFYNSSNSRYRTYVFGKGGVGSVSLEGYVPNEVVDPKRQNFNLNVREEREISMANPEGKIRGIVSYNFTYAAAILEGPAGIGGSFRFKTIDCASSIG